MEKKHTEPPKEPKDAAEGGQSGVLELETILRLIFCSDHVYACTCVSVCGIAVHSWSYSRAPTPHTAGPGITVYRRVGSSGPRQVLSLSLWSCDVCPSACLAHWRSEIEKTRGGPRESYYFTQTESHEVG